MKYGIRWENKNFDDMDTLKIPKIEINTKLRQNVYEM